jgi:hypothetical protein
MADRLCITGLREDMDDGHGSYCASEHCLVHELALFRLEATKHLKHMRHVSICFALVAKLIC